VDADSSRLLDVAVPEGTARIGGKQIPVLTFRERPQHLSKWLRDIRFPNSGGGLRVLLPTMPDDPSDVEYPESSGANSPRIENVDGPPGRLKDHPQFEEVLLRDRRCIAHTRHLREELTWEHFYRES
jgi:hypothetical protein